MEKKIEALMELIEIVERLRAPGGCPWDQQQTLNDMGRYLMEEVSEVVDAIDTSEGSPSAASTRSGSTAISSPTSTGWPFAYSGP